MPGGRGRRKRADFPQPVSTDNTIRPHGPIGPRRGRRRALRRVASLPPVKTFVPDINGDGRFSEPGDPVVLSVEEYEALRLVDYLDMDQEEASFHMGVSRRAFWQDLQTARFKIAKALCTGRRIIIEGGDYSLGEEVQNRP